MMNPSDIQARLSIYRYAILAVVITAFTVSLFSPVIMTANPNYAVNLSFEDVFIPALFVTVAALMVGVASYFVYANALKSTNLKRG